MFETPDKRLCISVTSRDITKVKIVDYIDGINNEIYDLFNNHTVVGQLSNGHFVINQNGRISVYKSLANFKVYGAFITYHFVFIHINKFEVIDDKIFVLTNDGILTVLSSDLKVYDVFWDCRDFSKTKNDIIMLIVPQMYDHFLIKYLYNPKIIDLSNYFIKEILELQDGRILLKRDNQNQNCYILDKDKVVFMLDNDYNVIENGKVFELQDGIIIKIAYNGILFWSLPIISLFYRIDYSRFERLFNSSVYF